MLLDFGSGHQPRRGFQLCDVDGWAIDYQFDPDRYRIQDLPDSSVRLLRCRNVLHHVPDLERIMVEFSRVVQPGGNVLVVEAAPEHFAANVFLDRLWYRGVLNRPEIWYAEQYRDYEAIFNQLFTCVNTTRQEEKEIKLFRRRNQ